MTVTKVGGFLLATAHGARTRVFAKQKMVRRSEPRKRKHQRYFLLRANRGGKADARAKNTCAYIRSYFLRFKVFYVIFADMNAPRGQLPITTHTMLWSRDLDTTPPIDTRDIPNFSAWINGSGRTFEQAMQMGHDGYVYGAYLRKDGTVVVGLPEETPVRAIADGVVRQIALKGKFGCLLSTEHGGENTGIFSQYGNVSPTVNLGTLVQKGDKIGTLYKDTGIEEGRLVGLFVLLVAAWGANGTSIMGGGLAGLRRRLQDPGIIDPSIYSLKPDTQGWAPFDPRSVGGKAIELAHFKKVQIGTYLWDASSIRIQAV